MRNAVEMESFFSEIERSDKFSEVYAGALSGLMKSFLKVSVMAYKSKNFRIAKRYYQQAQQIYDENADLVGNDFKVKQSFKEFVENQFGLAQMLIEDNYYEDAIELLDLATNISDQNQLEINQIEFDAAYKKGYSGIYGTLVDSIEYYIQQENRKSSLKALLHSAEFEKSHAHYLNRDERVSGYAVILFEYYMNGSLQKLHNDKPEEAIDFLFEARNINNLFHLNKAEQIDSAVRVAIAPIILQIIKKAEFEVWANRLDEAYVLKEQAENSANKYGLIEQKEIEYAMLNLEEKINNRVCIDIQYKVSNACKILVNRIKAGKFKEAELVLRTTKSLISKNPGCNIVNSDLDSLIKVYQPLFYYIENADSLVQQTGAADFFNIKIMYDDLKTSYFENELMEYIDEIPDLQKLMKEKGSIPEYHEAVEYYINQKDFLNAYYYLDLLKLNKVDARNTKHMQQTIGYEICKGEEDRSSLIFDLTKGDSWYKVLNKACLKN